MRGSRAFLVILAMLLGSSGDAPATKDAVATPDRIGYRFRLVAAPDLQVRVQAEFMASDQGETTFEVVRDWGGVTAGGDDITDVRIQDSSGKTLKLEHPEPHRWRVRSAPRARLVIDYAFAANDHQSDASPNVHRRPILGPSIFHAYGHLALLRPGHLDGRVRRQASIAWEGFESGEWTVVCSFGVGAGPHDFEASLDDLSSAVYMAGRIDLLGREVEGRPVWTALAHNDWRFAAGEFADLVQRIVTLERAFFDDFDHPFYLVTVIPVGERDTGGRSLDGTGLTNSLSLAMLPDTELASPLGEQLGIGGLLAHEMFHEWNGQTIVPEDPEQLVYWFSEGFTDFYTRRLLLRSGLIGPQEYAKSVNAKLAELLASPVCNAPNERVRADFWQDRDVQRLPYARGDVVAMLADAAIRRASDGTRSLDDLMRDLVRIARATGDRYDTEKLLRRIADRIDANSADHLRAIVVTGATPRVEPSLFEPCLEMRLEPISGFDLGFDFDRSRREGRTRGVRSGSAAEAAGLREDQKLRGWSVRFGDPAEPVELKIETDGGERTITYVPVGPPVPTPQFFVRVDSSGCEKL